MSNEPIVIVGASSAGISAAREIRSVSNDIPVEMFTEETDLPYYRPFLTEYIGDETVEKKSNFYLNPEKWYEEKRITLNRGEKIAAVDASSHTIETADGAKHPYARLILANGSSPFIPLKEAIGKKNVYSIRTLGDARAVRERAKANVPAIVIGGGLLGLEAAYSLSRNGIPVTVIEVGDRILPRQLDTECSAILQEIISRTSVKLLTGASVEAITGSDAATGVRLASGEELAAGMVIFSIGVRPNVDLAHSCGARVNRAVVVNERMETSVPGIYACGDVAEFNGKNIALWMPAMRQGKVAGSNAAGKEAVFADEVYPAILNSFGTRVYSVGDFCSERKDGEYRVHAAKNDEKGSYKKLFFVNDRIVGLILIGDISESQKLTTAIKSGAAYKDLVQ
ncbi:MAG TPA: FAD-dependent oxidoreductase [Spirochaetota bacterium]|nr:FAD-dependent oxidoreductase [Spirochaetota bacterium]HPC41055.1 FAD-dependent oxidoreductase [Spirochaetota bacterium]HPL18533.1 FAD-dependent oxidoreductase [Spirochaetota bacterium]HQF08832.1 FAD-dependent oxidoreductase [Spirochaetota bacterium]HQH97451.1 FAD-dependent oxidoreductase [Spirochaetota bacterium]